MRRYENSPSSQQASAFRVLSPGRQQVLQYDAQVGLHRAIPPPPPRAPEPYKLATPGRSSRKSAFAIIAEPPPPGSRSASRPASPTGFPASGRVSPFRGRGFKGPAPRARSRPHTPPRGTSAHSSPKRSLSQIPRPSNGIANNNNRVAPLSASQDDVSSRQRKAASPKFGRRAVNRYTSSVGSNNQRNGQMSAKTTTTTGNRKPSATAISNGKLKQKAPGSGQEINNKLLRVPPKNLPSGKRFVTANNNNNNVSGNNVNRINVAPRAVTAKFSNGTSDGSPESPSKIPLRNGASSLSASREMLNKPSVKQNAGQSNGYGDGSARDGGGSKMGKSSMAPPTKDQQSSPAQPTSEEPDLGLVDLLKQSSGATGTQSVVNTTTTTAVQPLQIDASSILAEAELVAKLSSLEKKQKEAEEAKKDEPSTVASSMTKKEQPPQQPVAKEDEKGKNGPLTQTMISHFGPNSKVNSTSGGGGGGGSSIVQIEQQKAPSESVVVTEKQPESSTTQQSKDEEPKSSKPSSKKASPHSSATSDNVDKKVVKRSTPTTNNVADASLTTQTQGGSSESLGSIRSTDTGVSLNTVRGVSSAKEKTGIHMVKRAEEIETLSGNVTAAAAAADSNGERALNADGSASNKAGAAGKWANLKSRLVKRLGCVAKRPGTGTTSCWPKMRCLACRRDPKAQLWPGKKARGASTIQLTTPGSAERPVKTRWDRFKDACRCVEFRKRRHQRRMQRLAQVRPMETPAATTTTTPPAIVTARKCCPINFGALCRGLFSKCTCCGRRRASLQSEHSSKRSKSVRAKHSLTSVNAPPLSEKQRPKLPESLVESNSVMRGAIPCLPIPIAWFCLMCNVVIPGSGTILSGLFNMCMGQPRFSMTASPAARFGAFVVNTVVGVSQLFTVLFCLVGWGWSIWWGVSMVRVARKYKRFKESEALANDPEARAGPETATLPAPGIPPLASLRPAADRPR